MWWRLSAGSCLEGNHTVSLYIGPQAWVLDRLGKNFDGTTKRLSKPALKSDQPNEIHFGRRVELGGEVHVAVGLGVAARDGAEQRQAPNPSLAQFRLMGAQRGDHCSAKSVVVVVLILASPPPI